MGKCIVKDCDKKENCTGSSYYINHLRDYWYRQNTHEIGVIYSIYCGNIVTHNQNSNVELI